jgi:hypothetical protein
MELVQSQTTIIPPSTCPSIGQHSKVPEGFVLCNASRVIKPLSYPPRQAHISPHPRVPEGFVLCNASRVIKPLSYPPRQAHISPHPRVPEGSNHISIQQFPHHFCHQPLAHRTPPNHLKFHKITYSCY